MKAVVVRSVGLSRSQGSTHCCLCCTVLTCGKHMTAVFLTCVDYEKRIKELQAEVSRVVVLW